MSKKYDVGMKVLLETHLADWLALVPRQPHGPVRVIDSDVATVTAATDKVLRIDDAVPWILHLELQSKRDPSLEWRVPWYNAILEYKHRCLVHSLVVLLTKNAETPGLSGEWLRGFGGETPYRVFRYQIFRVWEQHAEALANGNWGLFPLAPLCDDATPLMPGLIERMGKRVLLEHADSLEGKKLRAVTQLLLGLRYEKPFLELLLKEMNDMIDLRDLPSYQIIVAQGKTEGIRDTILRQGKKKFGKPSAEVLRDLNAIANETRLTELSERILDVDSWKDLLSLVR